MGRGVVLAWLTVWLAVGNAASGYGQAGEAEVTERAYHEQVTFLRAHIAAGWTPAQVVGVMGEPDRRGKFEDGPDVVEVWGYRGYAVIIEFRNGLVSNWFVRFMR